MYEFHTTQEGTGIHPGEHVRPRLLADGSSSCAATTSESRSVSPAISQRQTTAKTGPTISIPAVSEERYAVNCLGLAASLAFPKHKGERGAQVLQGVRESLDVSGILRADCGLDQLLG